MLFQSSNPGYYGTTAFLLFSPLSVIYTALSHVCFACLGSLKIQHVPTESIGTETPHVLNKKVAIVTGSNTGIGFETSRALADRGYEVILACRSRDKAMLAVRQIPNAVFLHPLDLSSKESIEEFATVVKAKYSTIHLLVNNAGLNTSGRLEGGLDLCFQTNFLGHFLLTGLLRPVLSSTGRVVNLSSVMHHFSDVEEKDERYWRRCTLYNEKQSTYTPSKLAALLFTIELNKRGIKSYAVNPGAVWVPVYQYSVARRSFLSFTNFLTIYHTEIRTFGESFLAGSFPSFRYFTSTTHKAHSHRLLLVYVISIRVSYTFNHTGCLFPNALPFLQWKCLDPLWAMPPLHQGCQTWMVRRLLPCGRWVKK